MDVDQRHFDFHPPISAGPVNVHLRGHNRHGPGRAISAQRNQHVLKGGESLNGHPVGREPLPRPAIEQVDQKLSVL